MNGNTKTQKASTKKTNSAESEEKRPISRYDGYFYNQINKLWEAVTMLAQENDRLRTQIHEVEQ